MTNSTISTQGETARSDGSILSDHLVEALKKAGTLRQLPRGSVLIEDGSAADAFYIVTDGRFNVSNRSHAFAEICRGEPIGEIAFFAGGLRSASVVAARASEVVEITRDAYEKLARDVPDLQRAIIAALAMRVRQAVPAARPLAPRAGQVIGVFPAAGGKVDPAFAAHLTKSLTSDGKGMVLQAVDGETQSQLLDRMARLESSDGRVVLLCNDPAETPDWAEMVFEYVDTVLLVLDPIKDGVTALSALEKRIAEVFLPPNVHLAILHQGRSDAITGTSDLLVGRNQGLHHHVKLGRNSDIDRVGRFLTGDAQGIVFGGGGAFGTAHLGLLKALEDHGYSFDMIGGSSVGAAMGGAYAMGLSPEEIIDRCDQLFLKSRAMKKLTVPFYSIIDHAYFDQQLRDQYGALRIEDLPLNFFAVATSLTRNDLSVLRSGLLWQAVRASSSIPAVFPPMVMDDGEVLIDGSYIDNVPVDTMRSLKPGLNLVMSLEQKKDWRVETDYAALPGRGGAMKRLAFGRKLGGHVRFPGIASIMTRSMIVNSEKRLATTNHGSDVFLPIQPIKGMGFLQWERGRELYDRTYQQSARALETASKGLKGVDLLREAARIVAEPSVEAA